MRRRILIVAGLVLLAAVIMLALALSGRFRTGLAVDAAQVRVGSLEVILAATGTVETRGADLAFEIPGRVAAVHVSEGTAVRRGTMLASLDAADLHAAAEQAEAAAAAARSDAARARAAVEGARQQAAQAEAAYRAAEANLAGLRAGASRPELRQADAAVEVARTAMEDARRNLAVQEQLFRQGAVAGALVDAARAQFETARAQHDLALARRDALRGGASEQTLRAASEQVRQAEAAWRAAGANVRQAQALASASAANAEQAEASGRAARVRAARAQLRAPFDGTVTRVYLNPGAPAAPGIPVLSLVTDDGWVIADVDEADIGLVRTGQHARVTADAYPGTMINGRVSQIGGQVDVRLGTRSVRVRVEIDGRSAMRAGTSVDVDLILQSLPRSLLIPLDAIQQDNGAGAYVYVIHNGLLRRRAVELGPRSDDLAVVHGGLQEGELVAIGDPGDLEEGRRVTVRAVP